MPLMVGNVFLDHAYFQASSLEQATIGEQLFPLDTAYYQELLGSQHD